MSVTEAIQQLVNDLPAAQQQELLDFGQFLKQKVHAGPLPQQPFKSLAGSCADLRLNLSADDIREARKELWHGFPRKDIA